MDVLDPLEHGRITIFAFKYQLTNFSLKALLTLYFFIAFLNDLIGTNQVSSKEMPFIRKFKDALFVSVTFPLSMFAGSIFWIIYAVNRELIFPKILDDYVPR